MPEISTLTLFALASLVLVVVPGPAVLYVVARSLEQGRTAGFVSVAGIGAGGLVHFIVAALGLSALLAASATAFAVIKYVGAAYLVYLGLRTLFERTTEADDGAIAQQPLHKIFSQGVIVQVFNPKMVLFALAFLPQFLDPARGAIALQALVLGFVFIAIALVSDGLYALLAGSLGKWLRQRAGFLSVQRYVSGTIYLALGVATALTGQGRK